MKKKVTMMSVSPMIFDSRIQNEAKSLREQGYTVTVIFVDDQKYIAGLANPEKSWNKYLSSMNGIKSVRVWLRSRMWTFLPGPLRKMAQALEMFVKLGGLAIKHRASVYHCHDLTPGMFCMLGALVYRSHLIYDAHELELEQGNRSGLGRKIAFLYEKTMLKWCRHAITVNPEIANHMEDMYGHERVHVIENRPLFYSKEDNSKSEFPVFKASKANEKFIVYVGYLSDDRGIFETVAALKHLPQHYVFLILGTGRIVEFREKVMDLVNELELDENRIRFVEPVEPDAVVPFLSHADLSLLLFRSGNSNNFSVSPNKFYQSVMARVPMLASDHDRLPELMNDANYGKLGMVVDASDSQLVAQRIIDIVESNDFKDNLDRMAGDSSWNHEAEKLVSLYETMGN